MSETLEALLQEGRTFPPSDAFRKDALDADASVYEDAERDWQGFWATQAFELDWTRSGTRSSSGTSRSPSGSSAASSTSRTTASTGTSTPATATRSRSTGRASPATPARSPYRDLLAETCRVANALQSLGIEKGDRVAIYMGMVPETVATMLACARIGAPHSVVFGGFSAQSLRDRINDAEAKVLITADGAWRRGAVVALKDIADEALAETPSIKHVRRAAAHRQRRRDAGRPRRVVARRRAHAAGRVPVRADGQRGPALPPLHVGHDRQAQGHHAHDGRLPHPVRVHAQVRLRPATRHRRVLVHRRRRLGDRALVHRLRPAREPRHERACTRARPTSPTRTASGRSSRSTRSRSSTPRRPPSGRS